MELTLNRIMVVDDDVSFQNMLREALEQRGGYTVALCKDGREAVEKAPAFGPDLILMDVTVPERDGSASLVALRALHETARTPVIFLSDGVCQQDVERYRQLGVQDVIRKSADATGLPVTVRNIWEWYNT